MGSNIGNQEKKKKKEKLKARKVGILPFPPNTFLRKERKIMSNATPANSPIIIANVFSPSLVDLSAFGNSK
jgi:hypothetical protein